MIDDDGNGIGLFFLSRKVKSKKAKMAHLLLCGVHIIQTVSTVRTVGYVTKSHDSDGAF
jgi:hypothetical protein